MLLSFSCLHNVWQGSNDAVVLDFWVRPKLKNLPPVPLTPDPWWARFSGYVHAASNEGSPAAVKLHGIGAMDRFQFEVNGERHQMGS